MRRLAAVVALVVLAAGCRAAEGDTPPETPPERRELVAGMPWLTVDDHPKQPSRDKNAPPSETYNRARDWMPDGWTDPDGNGCDTREDTLIRESLDPVACVHGRVSGSGRWWRVYETGQTSNAGAIEIDHVVSLGDAWRSGGWRWPVEKMRSYAQDPRVLMAVDRWANRDKSDRTAESWRPTNRLVWCTFGQRVWGIKAAYDLTVTGAELAGLRDLLRSC